MREMIGSRVRPYALAVAAAACFGASIPLSKLLLRDMGPVGLAGILYRSSRLGLGALRLILPGRREASLRRSDLGWLAVVVAAGAPGRPHSATAVASRST